MDRLKVAVLGAAGRMGAQVCRAVSDDPDLELVAAVDPCMAGAQLAEVIGVGAPGLVVAGSPDALAEAGAGAAVDFTRADAALENASWCASHGVHAVIGTTGLSPSDLELLGEMFRPGPANCIVAPNFAIGAVLLMRFAELAAPLFEAAEIVEMHHDGKIDAPSGTALLTAQRMAAARAGANAGHFAPDPTRHEALPGARGATAQGGVRIHSVRLRGMVAHQEVLLGTSGQSLTLRHDSYDRASFMPGVVLALKAVGTRRGLTVGIEGLLGI